MPGLLLETAHIYVRAKSNTVRPWDTRFFGKEKTRVAQNSFNFCYLIGNWSENRAAQGFHYINSFTSNIFGPNSKTYTCEVRAAWDRVSRGLTVYQITFVCRRGA